MLSPVKKKKVAAAIKSYQKKYLSKQFTDLDESGTRLMVNTFLTDILGYASIVEVKTEYMIRGTYADYMIQLDGKRYFLVEVKAFSIDLSDKHLRQAINYGANEGVEWALLTNGRCFDFYKILFNKPIESRLVFSINLEETNKINYHIDILEYLHKDSVAKKGLDMLWSKCLALDANNIAGLLYSKSVTNFLKKELKNKYKNKFEDNEIIEAINTMLTCKINLENVKPVKDNKPRKPRTPKAECITPPVLSTEQINPIN